MMKMMSESLSSVKLCVLVGTSSVSVFELFVNIHVILLGVTEGVAETVKVIVIVVPMNAVINEEGPLAETDGGAGKGETNVI